MAAEAGAIGFIEIPRKAGGRSDPMRRAGQAADRLGRFVGPRRFGAAGPRSSSSAFPKRLAARLFEGAPRSLAVRPVGCEGRAKAGPRGFALRPTLAIEAENKWEDFTSPEVVGLLKGSDPTLAAQHVVLMGHLDHLGVKPDAKPGEDAIYNGALDNAGGSRDHAGGGAPVRGAAGAAQAFGAVHRQYRRGARPAGRRLFRQSPDRPGVEHRRPGRSRHAVAALSVYRRHRVRRRPFDDRGDGRRGRRGRWA